MGMTKEGFFLGSCRSLLWALGGSFLGPWAVCQKGGGGLPKRRGDLKKGFLAEHRLKKRIICTCMRCQCNSLRGGAGQFLLVKKKGFLAGHRLKIKDKCMHANCTIVRYVSPIRCG